MYSIEKQISSKVVYKGYIINVTVDDISIEPNEADRANSAQKVIYAKREIVHHNGGVCCLIKLKNGKIPFVKQFRYAFKDAILELPAGKIEKGEDPLSTIIREAEEEIGIIPKEVISMGKIYVSPGISDEVLYLYYIEDYDMSKQSFDEDEFLEVIEYSYDEAIELINNETICDAKTVSLLLKCQKYFK